MNYPFSRLEKVQDQDIYRAVLPPGTEKLIPAAVPNKAADLCNKVVETLLTDPPRPQPEPETDDESAEQGSVIAKQFLTQDAQEAGMNDVQLFWRSVDAATSRSSAFHHYWIDPTGGGSVPHQIKAHPQATDPNNPLVAPVGPPGPDGQPTMQPTTDYVLRYVTADGQFTDDPSQAAQEWLPKINVDLWYREHVRTYPEDRDVRSADMVIGIYYCTLAEAKRRWPVVNQMDEDAQAALLDWTPQRYLVLLPPALKARWKLATGDTSQVGGSNDQRMIFWYVLYQKACPDYPYGAVVYCSGANGGVIFHRDTLSAEVPAPNGKGQERRALDIPVAQVRLLQDADDRDPMGRPLIERFAGANEAASTLATSYLEAMDILLHPARFATATSPLSSADVNASRASGDFAIVVSKDDFPKYEEPPPLPASFVPVLEWVHTQMDSASGLNKPAQGANDQQEVSGVARQVAVKQSLIALSRMQQAVVEAFERHWRIKCQMAMKFFTVPQLIKYVGEDQSYTETWWTGVDFASVTGVRVKPGTGTMLAPQDKVNYVAAMRLQQFIRADEAADAARPTFADTLGIPVDPQESRINRQVSSFLMGVPDPTWEQAQQTYTQVKQQADQIIQAAQAEYQQRAQMMQQNGMQPPPFQPPQTPPLPPMPFNPFAPPLPMDEEPDVAAIRKRRLGRLMATAKFHGFSPQWQQLAVAEYLRMRQVIQAAQQAAAQAQQQSHDPKAQGFHGKESVASSGNQRQNQAASQSVA